MDAPTSYFFSLEKKNGQRKVIHTLLADTGEELVEPRQIRERAVSFYQAPYSSEEEEDQTSTEELFSELPQISEESNSQLAAPLRMEELL